MFKPGTLCSFRPESVQGILDSLQEGIIAVDAELAVIAMNRAAVELFDLRPDELAGRRVCALFGEESCPVDCLLSTIANGEPIIDYQTTIRLSDGRPGEVMIRTEPLRGESGEIEAVAIILRDVTEVTTLRKDISRRHSYAQMIGSNQKMQKLYRVIEDVAPSLATIMIRGESGTGKELVARALHYNSNRADGPFVMVNCSALSENLLESELFGHVRGAFTGAVSTRRGRFEEASGGTIFLDEIGDVSPVVQVKLLRVLQQKVVEKVGDNTTVPVDVRVLSATNRDLEDLVATGRMREDFYYRIKVVSLDVPPLRERRDDIPLLVEHFLSKLRSDNLNLSSEVMRALMSYRWPGNVRELENAIEHASVLSRGGDILTQHLPPEIVSARDMAHADGMDADSGAERERILAALRRNGWQRSRTARELGMDRTTLWRKMKIHDLDAEKED
jgi:two-component system, NtrC family, response regulator HydG